MRLTQSLVFEIQETFRDELGNPIFTLRGNFIESNGVFFSLN